MKFGYWLPVFGGWLRNVKHENMYPTWDYVKRLAIRSEELGYDTTLVAELNLNDIKGESAPSLDAWSTAAALAAVTNSIEIMVAVRPTFHSPALLAKQASNIDHISNGRLTLNVVSSWWQDEAKKYGVHFEQHDDRYARTSEWLHVLDNLWKRDHFSFEGKYYRVEDTILQPKPVSKPRPFIYAGGESETAKNLILAGPSSVTLYDPTLVSINDLASNFYCREEDVGNKSRANASIPKLQELNPYVKVNTIDSLTLEDHANYHVVVYTEVFENIDKVIEADEFCRSKSIGFLFSTLYGAAGFAFSDFGNDFIITDADGEETKSFIVVNATQANPVIITVHEDKRHKFQDGDFIQFREVEGMTELNALPPTEIEVIDGYSFKLKVDGTAFSPYLRQGLVENIKVPKKVSYHSLK